MLESTKKTLLIVLEFATSLAFFLPAIGFGAACFFTSGLWFWLCLVLGVVSFFGVPVFTAWADKENDDFLDGIDKKSRAERKDKPVSPGAEKI